MRIIAQQLKEGKLLSALPQFKAKEEKARSDIVAMINATNNPYCSCSWGKQSIVLSHLVWSVDPTIKIVHFTGDDAELIGDFDNVRDTFLKEYEAPYEEVRRGVHFRDAVKSFNAQSGHDGVFVGLAEEESRGRRITCRNANSQNILDCLGMKRSTPLARWTVNDLAAYIAIHNLPLLSTYVKYGLDVRTSTGCRAGSYTEGAVDYISSTKAAEMMKRMGERNAL